MGFETDYEFNFQRTEEARFFYRNISDCQMIYDFNKTPLQNYEDLENYLNEKISIFSHYGGLKLALEKADNTYICINGKRDRMYPSPKLSQDEFLGYFLERYYRMIEDNSEVIENHLKYKENFVKDLIYEFRVPEIIGKRYARNESYLNLLKELLTKNNDISDETYLVNIIKSEKEIMKTFREQCVDKIKELYLNGNREKIEILMEFQNTFSNYLKAICKNRPLSPEKVAEMVYDNIENKILYEIEKALEYNELLPNGFMVAFEFDENINQEETFSQNSIQTQLHGNKFIIDTFSISQIKSLLKDNDTKLKNPYLIQLKNIEDFNINNNIEQIDGVLCLNKNDFIIHIIGMNDTYVNKSEKEYSYTKENKLSEGKVEESSMTINNTHIDREESTILDKIFSLFKGENHKLVENNDRDNNIASKKEYDDVNREEYIKDYEPVAKKHIIIRGNIVEVDKYNGEPITLGYQMDKRLQPTERIYIIETLIEKSTRQAERESITTQRPTQKL